MPHLAPAPRGVPVSGIREIVNLVASPSGPVRAAAGVPADVVRLESGEPGFPTPPHIVEAGARAARAGVGYTASAGLPALRSAISDRLARVYGLDAEVERIVVGQGAVQTIAVVFDAVLAPGDEVLVPDPGWPNYAMKAVLHGAVPVPYPMRAAAGFLPDVAEIAALITPRTRAIVLNSPANPTGAVLSRALLADLIDLAVRSDLLVVSDEVYDEIIFDGEPANAAALAPEHVAAVFSFSKTYAMTGWRVGYLLGPRWLTDRVAHLQEPLLSSVSTVSQAAALAALTGPQDFVPVFRDSYRHRRDLAVAQLGVSGVSTVLPAGAFYLMVPLDPAADGRLAALDALRWGVATAPGTAFGEVARDQLRISLAAPETELVRGVARLIAWHQATAGGAKLGGSAAPDVHDLVR